MTKSTRARPRHARSTELLCLGSVAMAALLASLPAIAQTGTSPTQVSVVTRTVDPNNALREIWVGADGSRTEVLYGTGANGERIVLSQRLLSPARPTATRSTTATLTTRGTTTLAPRVAPPTPTPQPTPQPLAPTPAQVFENPVYQRGLALWRNADPVKHPKGSCASCHGADFFDLARGGFDDETIRRRSLTDGATNDEATALIAATRLLRDVYRLPATNARTFRPFQPGGQVLEPALDANTAMDEANRLLTRDVAFGRQIEARSPTLLGAPIRTLADAQRIRDEVLAINMRTLKIGFHYPLWSSDRHFGEQFGSLNDWVADVGRQAKPGSEAAWRALEDAYLRNPSNDNFWTMYDRLDDLTERRFQTTGGWVNDHKLQSAMIGQHMMRTEALGQTGFIKPTGLAFSHLEGSPLFSPKLGVLLPNPMWHFGEDARIVLGGLARDAMGGKGNTQITTAQEAVGALKFPDFVVNSISPTIKWGEHTESVRLGWFWIGFTFDPSSGRIDKTNSTIASEYFLQSLRYQRLYMHHQFVSLVRVLYRGFVPEADADPQDNRDSNLFLPSWAVRAGEHLREHWNEDRPNQFSAALKAEHRDLWRRLTGNAYRASLLFYENELDRGRVSHRRDYTVIFDNFNAHFSRYHAATATEDTALVDRVRKKHALLPTR